MAIPVSDPRHPAHKDFTASSVGKFADRHARNERICADCGLIERHKADCPTTGKEN